MQRNRTSTEQNRTAIRMGINFGDIILEEGDVFGDGGTTSRLLYEHVSVLCATKMLKVGVRVTQL
jgi:class 3 adenylate cyclase